MGEFETDIPVTIENSPTPSSVYIRLCINSKKVFYCVYKNNFPDKKKQNSLFMALIKREILTSHKGLYTKFCRGNQFLFRKKDAF